MGPWSCDHGKSLGQFRNAVLSPGFNGAVVV